MFWKKKKNRENEAALFFYDNSCQRQFVRVRPRPSEAVSLTIDGQKVELLDISAGGLAFLGGDFRPGDVPDLVLGLPEERLVITGRLAILALDARNVRHCRYEGLTPKMVEALHSFVLRVQKRQLREEKNQGARKKPPDGEHVDFS
ncbi:MAG: PilZ domain-containing protein [Pseudomonadota bacterium]